ncbi:ankyrin repeat domain-containing protein [Candidatus Babeliales bacterium]|nr:ankyrin repeat domain-containing protein [Candidatus Babeliales bacterium]
MKKILLLIASLFLFQINGSLRSAAGNEKSGNEIIEELIESALSEKGNYREDTNMVVQVFIRACIVGRVEQVENIIRMCRKNDRLLVQLVGFKNYNTLHDTASRKGFHKIVEMLKEASKNTEHLYESQPYLMKMVFEKNIREINIALVSGSNVYEVDDISGINSLQAASLVGEEAIVEMFLSHSKAGIDHQSYHKQTALSMAAVFGHNKIVKMLLNYGANSEISDFFKRTPLLNATLIGNRAVMKILLDSGANKNAKDTHGKTSLDYVIEGYHQNNVDLFR